jgi:hypothetical protein
VIEAFTLPDGAGNARRLVRLSRVLPMTLEPAIATLAQTDCLPDDLFAGLPNLTVGERAAVQDLVDSGMRSVLITERPDAQPEIILTALRARPAKALILTHFPDHWRHWIAADPIPQVTIAGYDMMYDHEVVEAHREGTLILDLLDVDAKSVPIQWAHSGFCAQFSGAILSVSSRLHRYLGSNSLDDYALGLASSLIRQGGSATINPRSFGKHTTLADLAILGFKITSIRDLFFIFNIAFA